jgi:hypothetical protein
MPFSFETFAWAVSALFQLLAVCAYLLSFPDVDGVDDQLPDMPEVIQDSAIEMKITYSGIIFVFGFYTQVVVVKQHWNWWRKKMEEPDNSLMVMVGVYVHNLICNFFQVSHASMVLSSNLGSWLRKASCTTCGPPFFLASVFLVGIRLVAATSLLTISAVRATDNEKPKPTTHVTTHVSSRYVTRQRRRETGQQNAALTVEVNSARHTLAHRLIFTQVLDTIDRWVKHVSKEATFAADYVNALVVIARRRKAYTGRASARSRTGAP